MDSLRTLRTAMSEADKFYLGAKDSEQRRTAVGMALRALIEFNKSIIPPIASLVLTQHFERFMEISIGPVDETFRKSSGHGLTKSSEARTRDGLIAVAFSVLTEGGERAGNMSRLAAGKFVAKELNKRGIRDARGDKFASEQVINIYLETIKAQTVAKTGKPKSSASKAVATTIRDRGKDLAKLIYDDQRRVMAAWRMAGERAGKVPEALRTIAGRTSLAISFIDLVLHPVRIPAPR